METPLSFGRPSRQLISCMRLRDFCLLMEGAKESGVSIPYVFVNQINRREGHPGGCLESRDYIKVNSLKLI